MGIIPLFSLLWYEYAPKKTAIILKIMGKLLLREKYTLSLCTAFFLLSAFYLESFLQTVNFFVYDGLAQSHFLDVFYYLTWYVLCKK